LGYVYADDGEGRWA